MNEVALLTTKLWELEPKQVLDAVRVATARGEQDADAAFLGGTDPRDEQNEGTYVDNVVSTYFDKNLIDATLQAYWRIFHDFFSKDLTQDPRIVSYLTAWNEKMASEIYDDSEDEEDSVQLDKPSLPLSRKELDHLMLRFQIVDRRITSINQKEKFDDSTETWEFENQQSQLLGEADETISIKALHEPIPDKLSLIENIMRDGYGTGPIIKVCLIDDCYHALEGSHRLAASHKLVTSGNDEFKPTLIVCSPDEFVHHDIVNLPENPARVHAIIGIHNSTVIYRFNGPLDSYGMKISTEL